MLQLTRNRVERSGSSSQKPGSKPAAPARSSGPVEKILHLQRTIGNPAVLRLMRSGWFQAKLNVSRPGDLYEREADRVADQVMRMPHSAIQRKST